MDYRYSMDFGSGYVDVPQPFNHAGVQIQLIFTGGQVQASVMSTEFEWLGDTAKKINDYIEQGTAGGRGIYEGIGLKIEACNQNLGFDLILDLAHENARYECDRVSCPIKESGKVDWLNTVAAGFNFWYLSSPTYLQDANFNPLAQITFSDYKKTPYVITEIPNGTRIVSLTVPLFILTWQAVVMLQKLIDDAVILAGYISNSVQLGGGVGLLVAGIVNVMVDIIQIYFLVNEIIKLVHDIIDNIIQAKKYKLCMRVEDLFKKACAYLGLSFSSSIFSTLSIYYDTTWMPKKIVQPVQDFNLLTNANFKRPEDENSGLGTPYGYYDGTFKDFIEDMMVIFNAEVLIKNGVLYFEEKHYWNIQNAYVIDNTDEIGFTYNLPAPHGTNASECPSNYALAFQLDDNELNTIHEYVGTTCDVQVQPLVVGNNKHLLNSNGLAITFPCALAKRKETLTKPEMLINDMIDELNKLVPALNIAIPLLISIMFGLPGFIAGFLIGKVFNPIPNNILTRIGWLQLSNDSFSIPKIFVGTQIGDDWELHSNNYERMSAQALMYWFHGKNLATRGNQYLTYFDKKFKFCCADFQKVLDSNYFKVYDESGQLVYGKFTKMVWDLESEIAIADYRINELFTTNLTERLIIDGQNGNVLGVGGSTGGGTSGQGGGGSVWPQ